jgi:hypothetical protein
MNRTDVDDVDDDDVVVVVVSAGNKLFTTIDFESVVLERTPAIRRDDGRNFDANIVYCLLFLCISSNDSKDEK